MNRIVLGSFFGDEGKGQTVHNLCKESPREGTIVVRFSGGHQVGHTVRCGELEHTFSNFGSGTLLGIPTYWSNYCTVDPITAMKELGDLNKLGISPEIIYHPLCEVVTPFDVISQWNDAENLRHGTVGTGFKPTLDRAAAGYHLTVVDCLNLMVLRNKIASIIDNYYHFDSVSHPMYNIDEWCISTFSYFSKMATVADISYLKLFSYKVFEGSQGILLDQRFGIMPYCTPSNTTCQNAMEIINKLPADCTEHVYVTRPYITRHGNGPFPSVKPIIDVEDPNNKFNEFQKTMRAIEFDIELFKHSMLVDSMFYPKEDKKLIVVTHQDEIPSDFPHLEGAVSFYDKLCYNV